MQASDEVSPPLLIKAMSGLATHPTLATVMFREQLRSKRCMVPRNLNMGYWIRQVHQTSWEGEPNFVQHGDEVLAETRVREVEVAQGAHIWSSRTIAASWLEAKKLC